MTGLYPHQAGIGHMVGRERNGLYNGDLSHDAITLAEGLKAAGYDTYMTGKWHLTPWRPDRTTWRRTARRAAASIVSTASSRRSAATTTRPR